MIGLISARVREFQFQFMTMQGAPQSAEFQKAIKVDLSEVDRITMRTYACEQYEHTFGWLSSEDKMFCFASDRIRQEQREQESHLVIKSDWLEFFNQRKATHICGNQLLPSQGQTDIQCKTQTSVSGWSHGANVSYSVIYFFYIHLNLS